MGKEGGANPRVPIKILPFVPNTAPRERAFIKSTALEEEIDPNRHDDITQGLGLCLYPYS